MAERILHPTKLTESPRFLCRIPGARVDRLRVYRDMADAGQGEELVKTVFTRESNEGKQFLDQLVAVDPFFDHAPYEFSANRTESPSTSHQAG